jgi:hypothetical protein
VTHEHHEDRAHAEVGGPESDETLPDAASIPVYENPEDADAPPMGDGDQAPVFNSLAGHYAEDGTLKRHVPVWVS